MNSKFTTLFLLGLVTTATAHANPQCTQLADAELKLATSMLEYRMNFSKVLNFEEHVQLKDLTLKVLDSADRNYTLAVFAKPCTTDVHAIEDAGEYFKAGTLKTATKKMATEILKATSEVLRIDSQK